MLNETDAREVRPLTVPKARVVGYLDARHQTGNSLSLGRRATLFRATEILATP
ncbi:hypothetical protein [Aurantimonas marianensis]|uniref:Uncharacterized protein n=1 Tax=Aurantimonas marianensis TaxID=2920428 RepID=A0A9X2H1C3_9HYPH|nr:hypothetical protein [Aurantimonas marianensis]MCP3053850.1 hypothetical protein [Aurantimonas marianensis]